MSATRPEHKSVTEEISGLIERVTFHNDESGNPLNRTLEDKANSTPRFARRCESYPDFFLDTISTRLGWRKLGPGKWGTRRLEIQIDVYRANQALGLACRVLGLNTRWRFVMLPSILSWLALVSPLALAIVLVRKYVRTRDIGFVWLGAAGVIWPLVSGLLVSRLLILDKAV